MQRILKGQPAPVTNASTTPVILATVAPPTPLETPRAARKRRHARRPVAETTPSPSASPAASNAAPAFTALPSPTPTVQLVGARGANSAQGLIDDAAKRLAGVDRAKLTAAGAATYDQARSLLASAITAERQGDELAAAGFAGKASALARSLTGAR